MPPPPEMLGSQAYTTMPGLCNAGIQQSPVHARQVLYQLKHSTRPSQSSFFTCFIYVGRYAVRHHAHGLSSLLPLQCSITQSSGLDSKCLSLPRHLTSSASQPCSFFTEAPSNVVYRVHAAPPASSSFSLLRCRAAQEAPSPPVNLRKCFRSL